MRIGNKKKFYGNISSGVKGNKHEKEVSSYPEGKDSFIKSSAGEVEGNSEHSELFSLKKPFERNSVAKNGTDINTDSEVKKSNFISSLEMKNYMIPANEGKISHLCLTYSGDEQENYFRAMKTFMSHMPSAKFSILTESASGGREVKEKLQEWIKEGILENPERIKVINTEQNLSIWAQDSTLVIGNKVVEQDRMWHPGSGDGAVAGELAKEYPELQYKKIEGIFIDGGNQLATRDTLFVGSDAIAFMVEHMKDYPAKYNKIISDLKIKGAEKLEREDLAKLMIDRTFPHQKVKIMGYRGKQPAFHIDMGMTPLGKIDPETGKKVVTVADPSMAVRILDDIKEKDPEKYRKYESMITEKFGWSNNFFTRLLSKLGLAPTTDPLDLLMKKSGKDKKLQESFDAIAKGLEADGYKIERVPYLGVSHIDDVPWITYNNSVIDGDNIFIPNFDIPELDDFSNNVYKKYGYNTIPIDMTEISALKGAINCITKVIERDYS